VPARLVFWDCAGRELTIRDLKGFEGRLRWEVIDDEEYVPETARWLHEEAREHGRRRDYDRTLALLDEARLLAPDWPYPVYDMAFTHLLQGQTSKAEELYAEVDRMAPRGYFTCKVTLNSLRREHSGELPAGLSKAFLLLEPVTDLSWKKTMLKRIVAKTPAFAPAWQKLAYFTDDRDELSHAIARGLDAAPDDQTRGLLLISKATMLLHGSREQAVRILADLALDPASTLGTEMFAKAVLALVNQE
jgi:hypothetical protein